MDSSSVEANSAAAASSNGERRPAKRARRSSQVAGSSSAAAPEPAAGSGTDHLTPSSDKALEHLSCAVCLSIPEDTVMQCQLGHIICAECHLRVCIEDKPICPTCRMPLDPLNPIRNVLAEQTIALLPAECTNAGCTAKCTRGTLRTHLSSECAYRTAVCKYHPLGCKWSGLHRACGRHEDRCKKADMPGWKLLKKVEQVQEAQAAGAKREREAAKADALVVAMLSTRCRNIEVSHVTLHKCSAHEHVASRPAHLASAAFHAIGWRFKLYTVHDSANGTYQVALQMRDSRELPVDFFVVCGPGIRDVRPTSVSHIFGRARDARTSTPVTIAEGDAAAALANSDSLVLRIGIADRRPGRLSRDFQGQSRDFQGQTSYGGGGYGDDDVYGEERDDDDDDSGWNSESNEVDDFDEDDESLYDHDEGPPRRYR